jgi:hypothetical protein
MQDLIKQHLSRAQERMKRQADKKRSERSFTVGDFVYLKLHPYIQSSLARRNNKKLAFKFFGPFKIINKIGAVMYKLLLPESSSIHPVFHVSQLKKVVSADHQVIPHIPELSANQVPVAILQRRLNADSKTSEVLVQWSGMPASLATWENAIDLHSRFPQATAWVKPLLLEGGQQP